MIELNISAMTCGHCAGAVTQAVKETDPQARVEIDLATKKVRIDTVRDRATIEQALAQAGYKPD
jgi:copper chaperone